MKTFGFTQLAAAAALALALNAPASATVINITLGDFSNPAVLDFQSVATGSISGTSSVFTDFGISSVTTATSVFTDPYNIRTNSTRALWANSAGLTVVDPGATLNAQNVVYTLDFAGLQTKFGFGTHDEGTTFTVEFFNDLISVGSIILFRDVGADLTQFYLESTLAFDRVVINSTNVFGGFAIDNLTLETEVPEPATLGLFGIGLFALVFMRRRKAVIQI